MSNANVILLNIIVESIETNESSTEQVAENFVT